MDEFFNHVQEKIHDENGTTNWTRPDSFKDLNNRLLNLDWKDPGAVKDYIKACKTIRIYFEKYKEVDNWERFINGNPYGPVLTILLLEKELWDYYLTLNTGREPLDLEKEYGFSMPYPIAQHHEKLKSDLFTELGLKTEPRPGAQSEGEGVSNSIDKSIAKRLYGGKRSYRIAIMPHLGNWDSSGIFNDIARFNTPIEIYPLTGNGNILPPRLQFLKIVPENLIFSCLKPSEHDEGVILRLFNPSGNQIEGEITTHLPIKSLRLLTLEEKIIERLELTDAQHFRIMVPPRKIVTIKIVFKESGD